MLSVLRVVAALVFIQHGMQKIFGFPPAATPQPPYVFASLIGLAGVIELGGGLLMVAGLMTRPVAFILSGEMAVAYVLRHAPVDFWPITNHGELAVLFCFLFLYFSFVGGGAWSLDTVLAEPTLRLHAVPLGLPERRATTRREEDRARAS